VPMACIHGAKNVWNGVSRCTVDVCGVSAPVVARHSCNTCMASIVVEMEVSRAHTPIERCMHIPKKQTMYQGVHLNHPVHVMHFPSECALLLGCRGCHVTL
jgi:hypothetical protein